MDESVRPTDTTAEKAATPDSGGTFAHKSVLLKECIESLAIRPDGIYVDGTAGGGGHSFEIAKRLDSGRLIAIDRDSDAILAATKRLSPFAERCTVVHDNYSNIAHILDEAGVDRIDGILLDLGVSSYQLDTPERGFSYMASAPLDMRMDKTQEKSAYDVVNTYSEQRLKEIIYTYGEERFAPRIAERIVRERSVSPIRTTGELAQLIKDCVPSIPGEKGHHPAKRTFQAIRIEVNGELDAIAPALKSAVSRLNAGGRMAVITFHSLEDRLVKQTFADMATGCTCPKTLPVCVCGRKPIIRIVNKKPILPSLSETEENPRSRSAKLRVVEKI